MYYLQAGDCDVTCPHLDDMRLITSVNDRPSFSYNRQGFVDDYMLPVGLTAKDPNLVMGGRLPHSLVDGSERMSLSYLKYTRRGGNESLSIQKHKL